MDSLAWTALSGHENDIYIQIRGRHTITLTLALLLWVNNMFATGSNSAFALKCPQYKARTNFIRLMAMSANHFHMTWHVAGSFIRHLISGTKDIEDSSMLIFLTPKQNIRQSNNAFAGLEKMMKNVTSMMNELEIMGMDVSRSAPPFVTKGPAGLEPSHVSVEFQAQMFIADTGNITFSVSIKAFDKETSLFDDTLYPFSTDTIVLGPTSLHVVKRNHVLDKMNEYSGIALLERMVKIQQEKSIVQVNKFANNYTYTATATNATLMQSIKQIKKEGFNVIGETIEMNNTCNEGMCPICLESNETFVSLECTHAFCLGCLASHLMSSVNGAECPMCRARIVPLLKATTM